MLETLHSQLQFVRALQSVDTKGVEPLAAIREETAEAREEGRIGVEVLKEVLGAEGVRGRMKRPRRRRVEVKEGGGKGGKVTSDGGLEWEPLGLAPGEKKARYFTVRTKGKVE